MGRYFGTDGIRGQANKTLTVETAFKVGRFIGDYYLKNGNARIVIGKDTRLSSSMFENALACGISASGSDVYLLGFCSTPSLAYIAMKEQFSCGVMVSASHNPFYDNGIKIFGNNGLKIQDDIESLIEDYIDGKTTVDYRVNEEIGKVFYYGDEIKQYHDWLIDLYPEDLSNFKIIVDLANGSNSYIAKDVLDSLHADATYINGDPDGTNINNKCGSTHLEMLQEFAKTNKYDLGFAFDGDADRVLFVDGDGEVVNGDQIMFFLSKYLKDMNILDNNTLVTTVMSNIGLYKTLDKYDISYDITPVGDKNVVDSMINNGFCIGGEQSGHIICSHDCNFGDGLKTALFVLNALKHYGISLKDAVKEVKIYPQLLINERVKDKKIVLNDEEIKMKIDEITKTLGNNGRILVRPSGTEPLIRVMVEAESDELCNKYVYEVIDLIKKKGYAEA